MRTCDWGECGHHESCPHQNKLGTGGMVGEGLALPSGGWRANLHSSLAVLPLYRACRDFLPAVLHHEDLYVGEIPGTAAINLLHSLQAQPGFCRTESLPPCRKRGSGSRESTLQRGPSLSPSPAEAAHLPKRSSQGRHQGAP